MEYKDYYKILGVNRDATADEIKKIYRKLAQKYHPDKNPGDKQSEDRFKEINEAYDVLGDPTKRAKYDQLGSSYRAWERTGRSGGFDWSQWTRGTPGGVRVEVGDIGDIFDGFSDFFNAIFGGMAGQGQDFTQRRPRDVEQAINISLMEAFNGTTRVVHVDGRKIEVKIPRGSRTGTRVRINLQKGSRQPTSGNLYLLVNVTPDPSYERNGDDLYVDVDLDLYSAVLGTERRIQTPAGDVMLTIPAGSQPGQTLRLQGRGMPKLRHPSQHGDLYARLQVELPKALSQREKDLFQELADLSGQ